MIKITLPLTANIGEVIEIDAPNGFVIEQSPNQIMKKPKKSNSKFRYREGLLIDSVTHEAVGYWNNEGKENV